METNRVWFYLVVFIAGSYAQTLGFWSWVSALVKFAAVGFWTRAWAVISSIPGKLAAIGGAEAKVPACTSSTATSGQ